MSDAVDVYLQESSVYNGKFTHLQVDHSIDLQ